MKRSLTICAMLATLLIPETLSGCATTRSGAKQDRDVPEGQWNRLSAGCVRVAGPEGDTFSCERRTLEESYDWMVDAFYDLEEYKLRLKQEQSKRASERDRASHEKWVWGSIGVGIGALAGLLGVMAVR